MTKTLSTALLFFALTSFLNAGEQLTTAQFGVICGQAHEMDDTQEGRDYEARFGQSIQKDMQRALKSCAERTQPPYVVNLVVVLDAKGNVEHIFADPDQPVSACVAGKLERERLPSPPHGDWFVLVNIKVNN